jgi:hypothetical protein
MNVAASPIDSLTSSNIRSSPKMQPRAAKDEASPSDPLLRLHDLMLEMERETTPAQQLPSVSSPAVNPSNAQSNGLATELSKISIMNLHNLTLNGGAKNEEDKDFVFYHKSSPSPIGLGVQLPSMGMPEIPAGYAAQLQTVNDIMSLTTPSFKNSPSVPKAQKKKPVINKLHGSGLLTSFGGQSSPTLSTASNHGSDKTSSSEELHSSGEEMSDIDFDSPNGAKGREVSRRTVTSQEERNFLERIYKENPYPTRAQYDDIRRQLGWSSSRRVTKWFNNKRYNHKSRRVKDN